MTPNGDLMGAAEDLADQVSMISPSPPPHPGMVPPDVPGMGIISRVLGCTILLATKRGLQEGTIY